MGKTATPTSTPVGHQVTVKYSAAHLLPYALPWGIVALLMPVALLLWTLWGRSSTGAPWAAAGLALATVALTWMASRAGRARATIVRFHAALAVALSGGWLLTAVIAGPGVRPLPDLWLGGGAVLAISFNLRMALRGNGGDHNDGWGDLAGKVGLAGSRMQSVTSSGVETTARLHLAPGEQTANDVSPGRIASALGVPTTGVQVTPDPDRADVMNVKVVARDMLKKPTPWPGPSAPGKSIAEPIYLGVYNDGRPVKIWLPGDKRVHRISTHVLIAGMTGAGKSAGGLLLLAEALTRSDVEVWVSDTVKGQQTLRPILGALDRVATTDKDGKAMVTALKDKIQERADHLAARGLDQWEPGCGIAYLLAHFEEAAALLSDSRAFIRVAQQARSAGISLVVSLQRPTHTNLPTDVRSQMAAVLCFGVKDGDEVYALSESTVDAGARPSAWGASRPGYFYLEAPGVDDGRWATPARTFLADGDQLGAAVADRRVIDGQVVEGTVGQGPTVNERATPISAETDAGDEGDDFEPTLPPNPEPDLPEQDPHEPIVYDLPPMPLGQPAGPEYTTEAARSLLVSAVNHLRGTGRPHVRPADLVVVKRTTGRSASWISAELKRLVEAGVLVSADERGVYLWPDATAAATAAAGRVPVPA